MQKLAPCKLPLDGRTSDSLLIRLKVNFNSKSNRNKRERTRLLIFHTYTIIFFWDVAIFSRKNWKMRIAIKNKNIKSKMHNGRTERCVKVKERRPTKKKLSNHYFPNRINLYRPCKGRNSQRKNTH